MQQPVRAPTWVSTRRLFEEKLSDINTCNDLSYLKQIHARIYRTYLHQDPFVAPKLVSAYAHCRQMTSAVKVFNQFQNPNVHLYNTMIRAHIRHSQLSLAFDTFFLMQFNSVYPDNFTYSFLLKGCNGKSSLRLVQMIHTQIEKYGFLSDIFVPNCLIDCYSKCGCLGLSAAKKLFTAMGERDVVSWNTLISGLVKAGELKEARRMFDEMPDRDIVSCNTILDGYTKFGEMNDAFELFQKMSHRNVVSWTIMLWGYCKAGDMGMAKMLFDKMPVKNVISWTILISGYARKGFTQEAVKLYDQMEKAGLEPDDGTIISILGACAESGFLGLGQRVHKSMDMSRYRVNTHVINALLDMYAKCGHLNQALRIFKAMEKRDLVSWNAIIHGLAMHGYGEKALQLFSSMKEEGFIPDRVTLVCVLCACTHAGFVDEGIQYFDRMQRDYGIVPGIEHYGCVIDLLGRGGRLEEAFSLLRQMPVEPNAIIWGTLLGACRMYNAVEFAEEVVAELVKLEPRNAGNLSMLSNIYAADGDWGQVAAVRSMIQKTCSERPSGASLIELDDKIHEFTVVDKTHPKSDQIYQMVDRLNQHLKKVGYAPKAYQ